MANKREIVKVIVETLRSGLSPEKTHRLLTKAMAAHGVRSRAAHITFEAAFRARERTFTGSETQPDRFFAWFLLNSGKRVQDALAEGKPVKDVKAAEARFAQQHVIEQAAREQAAADARGAADVSDAFGGKGLFKWVYANELAPCTPIQGVLCKDLDGRVFSFRKPPQGTLPGTRHPRCRCRAVPVL